MASLEAMGDLLTEELRSRVDRLVSAIGDDDADFADVSMLADEVASVAAEIEETYGEVERLLGGLRKPDSDSDKSPSETTGSGAEPSAGERHDSPASEEATKDELLERAREANIHGRSSMSKEELADAVEAEENLSKEELLDRARRAGIEGRSSMTKDELRAALRTSPPPESASPTGRERHDERG